MYTGISKRHLPKQRTSMVTYRRKEVCQFNIAIQYCLKNIVVLQLWRIIRYCKSSF